MFENETIYSMLTQKKKKKLSIQSFKIKYDIVKFY